MGNTTNYTIPYPEQYDIPDGAGQMKAIADRVDQIVKNNSDAIATNTANIASNTAAIAAIPTAPPAIQVFTANGTWTKPAGAQKVWVRVQGGGGSGGGCPLAAAAQYARGSGAGAGGYAEGLVDASALTATVAVTVGQSVAGNPNTAGNDGNPSSFGAYLTASGGIKGVHATSNATGYHLQGGAGGVGGGTLAQLMVAGGPGGGAWGGASYAFAGVGGNSVLGGGGLAPGTGTAPNQGNGNPGGNYGGGGSGGFSNAGGTAATGGAGAAGVIIVISYF